MSDLPEAPEGLLETSLGPIRWVVNEGWHAYLDTGRRQGYEGQPLLVNRVEYHTSLHLFLKDGAWITKDWHDLHMYRPGTIGSDASDSARKKAMAVLTAAWTEFISAAPELLVQGEIYAVTRQALAAEEEIQKLQEKLREQTETHEGAIARLRTLGYFGPNKQDWSARF